MGAYHRLADRTTGGPVPAMGPGVSNLLGHSHCGAIAVAVDSHGPGCGGEVQITRGVFGTQLPGAPA